jgi:hypothetical protein
MYMKMQENKRREFEREQEQRRTLIYKDSQHKNTFSQLKREFLAGGGVQIQESRPPVPIGDVLKPLKPPSVAKSLDFRPPPVTSAKTMPVRASDDRRPLIAKVAPVVKLPVVGKGTTKLPLFRK